MIENSLNTMEIMISSVLLSDWLAVTDLVSLNYGYAVMSGLKCRASLITKSYSILFLFLLFSFILYQNTA